MPRTVLLLAVLLAACGEGPGTLPGWPTLESERLRRAKSRRAFVLPLNNPSVVGAAEASHMRPDDLVVGVLAGNAARAYPWWILMQYHVANDLLDGAPVYVALCEYCSGAAAFSPLVDGEALDFRICGIRDGTFEVADFQTGSRWHPFAGVAREGRLAGRRLTRLSAYQSRWDEWVKLHPETTVVLAGDDVRARTHGKGEYVGSPVLRDSLDDSVRNRDGRLESAQMVFGLISREGGRGRAYGLAELRDAGGVLQVEFEGVPVLLVLQGEYRVGAFVRRAGDETLRLEVLDRDPLRLKDQAGNEWDEWGRAVKGPRKGERLDAADGYLTEWYEWVSAFPGCELSGE